MTGWDQELMAYLNRNVMASTKERAPPRLWPVSFHDGRAFVVSPDSIDVRGWYYVDTQRVLAWLRKGCEA